jgi:4-hydroxy-tetrahydrodipicolinate synthase
MASPGFALLSGDDPTFVRAMMGGANGVISVASNAVPASFSRICRYLAEGNFAAAEAMDSKLRNLYDFLGVEPNPIPVKALMKLLGFGHGLRMPLLPLSQVYETQAIAMAELCKTMEQSL